MIGQRVVFALFLSLFSASFQQVNHLLAKTNKEERTLSQSMHSKPIWWETPKGQTVVWVVVAAGGGLLLVAAATGYLKKHAKNAPKKLSSDLKKPSSESEKPSSEPKKLSSHQKKPSSDLKKLSSDLQKPSSHPKKPSSESKKLSSHPKKPSSDLKKLSSNNKPEDKHDPIPSPHDMREQMKYYASRRQRKQPVGSSNNQSSKKTVSKNNNQPGLYDEIDRENEDIHVSVTLIDSKIESSEPIIHFIYNQQPTIEQIKQDIFENKKEIKEEDTSEKENKEEIKEEDTSKENKNIIYNFYSYFFPEKENKKKLKEEEEEIKEEDTSKKNKKRASWKLTSKDSFSLFMKNLYIFDFNENKNGTSDLLITNYGAYSNSGGYSYKLTVIRKTFESIPDKHIPGHLKSRLKKVENL